MSYTVYTATSPSDKIYIGITKNFKQRLKSHKVSKYPFGKALRKYGSDNFKWDFIKVDTLEEAYSIEEKLITTKEVLSDKYYNLAPGGPGGITKGPTAPLKKLENREKQKERMLTNYNPMKRPEVREKWDELMKGDGNPMNDPETRERWEVAMRDPKVRVAQKVGTDKANAKRAKEVKIGDIIYPTVASAALAIDISRSALRGRIKSVKYPEFSFIDQ